MKRVLVPIHHEPGCLPAVDVAIRVAQGLGVAIDLVSVRDPGGASAEEVIERARATLAAADVTCTVIRLEGKAGAAIAHQAEGASVVVMRSQAHRAPGSEEGQVKSTTLKVLETAHCPVLAVTERDTLLADALFAYNGSRQSRRAIETALELLAPTLIKRGTVAIATADRQMGERLLSEFDELAWSKGVNLRKHIGLEGRPSDVLLARGESSEADILVMGAQGRSWLQEKLFGSTTNRMLRRCPVPIWMAS